jgi:hypothetical protein
MNEDRAAALVDANGRPARRVVKDDKCPRCGSGPDKRVMSGGFGQEPHPICTGGCSPAYEWSNEL